MELAGNLLRQHSTSENVMRTADAGLKLLASDVTWVMKKESKSLVCYPLKKEKFILID